MSQLWGFRLMLRKNGTRRVVVRIVLCPQSRAIGSARSLTFPGHSRRGPPPFTGQGPGAKNRFSGQHQIYRESRELTEQPAPGGILDTCQIRGTRSHECSRKFVEDGHCVRRTLSHASFCCIAARDRKQSGYADPQAKSRHCERADALATGLAVVVVVACSQGPPVYRV